MIMIGTYFSCIVIMVGLFNNMMIIRFDDMLWCQNLIFLISRWLVALSWSWTSIDMIIIWYDTSWFIMISMIYDTSWWYRRWQAALCAQSWSWTTTTVSPTPTPCQSGSPSYFYRWLLSLRHWQYKVDVAQWRLIVVVTLIVIHWWGIPWFLNDTVGQSVAPPITTVYQIHHQASCYLSSLVDSTNVWCSLSC